MTELQRVYLELQKYYEYIPPDEILKDLAEYVMGDYNRLLSSRLYYIDNYFNDRREQGEELIFTYDNIVDFAVNMASNRDEVDELLLKLAL